MTGMEKELQRARREGFMKACAFIDELGGDCSATTGGPRRTSVGAAFIWSEEAKKHYPITRTVARTYQAPNGRDYTVRDGRLLLEGVCSSPPEHDAAHFRALADLLENPTKEVPE